MSKKKHRHRDKKAERSQAAAPAQVLAPSGVPADAPAQAPAAAPVAQQEGSPMYEPIREYRLKFYLNAQHYVVFDGKRGQTHPHTWEFTLVIEVSGLGLTPFSAFERGIEEHLAPFQNKVLNGLAPFDTMLPTLENLVEEFVGPFGETIERAGGKLVSLEGSEGPTRSYIVRERREAQVEFERQNLQAERGRVIDDIVGGVLG